MYCTTHLSGILLWEQSALFHGFFSQHDWLSDYFHFCLCWQRWQKDYIPVEGKGDVRRSDKLDLLSVRSPTLQYYSLAKPVFMGQVSAPVLCPHLCGRSGWSTHAPHHLKGRERDHWCPHFTSALWIIGVLLKQAIFPLRTNPTLSHCYLLEHIFDSKKGRVLLCWNLSVREIWALQEWFSLLSCLIRLTWVQVRFTHTYVYKYTSIFYGHMQELCWKDQKWRTLFWILGLCCLTIYEKWRQRKINSQSLSCSPVVLMGLFLKCMLWLVSLSWYLRPSCVPC